MSAAGGAYLADVMPTVGPYSGEDPELRVRDEPEGVRLYLITQE